MGAHRHVLEAFPRRGGAPAHTGTAGSAARGLPRAALDSRTSGPGALTGPPWSLPTVMSVPFSLAVMG